MQLNRSISLAKVIMITSGILTLTTILALASLSHTAHADSVVDDVTITVPESCTFSEQMPESNRYTVEVAPGHYTENIGSTTFQVFCNDNNGYSVYAVGYSGNTIGNTDLISSNENINNIATGITTSGTTSSWSMKMLPVTGTYAPTIENNYNNYKEVPSAYTKVATFPSLTDRTTGSSFQAKYAIYAGNGQAAGTFTGKVKYTLVHPASEVPNQPHDATAGCISYWPNASGVVDNMGDQCRNQNNQQLTDNMANVDLWPTNFKREGYGFAGWSDKFDWVLNENDANGNGTGANAGYHIYGPMQSITTPADMTTKGLSLYAVWVKSTGTLQDFTCPNDTTMPIGTVTALKDARDDNVYTVAKLADGKCWMAENLRLDYTANITPANTQSTNNAFGGVFSSLAEPETANFADSTTANSLYKSDGSGDIKGVNGATLSDIGTSGSPSRRFPRYRNDNTNSDSTINPNTTVVNQTNNSSNIYSYGNYYSWAAAIADTGYYYANNQTVATSSICPTGWHLPSGGLAYASNNTGTVNVTGKPETYREFYNLGYKIMGSDKTAYEDTVNTSSSYYSSNTTNANGDTATAAFRRFPNNFLYSGYINGSSVSSRSSNGNYWSNTALNNSNAYRLILGSSDVYPGTIGYIKSYGLTIRCLAGS